MFLDKIRLINFKNYRDISFEFSSGINCILGPNGSGKTTLLDAIHYLSMTRSAVNSVDSQNIGKFQDGFSIKGNFGTQKENHQVSCTLYRGKKKAMKVNGNEYEKISDHIGLLPVVLISPDDVLLINEGSEVRRKYFDSIISQVDREYLENLIKYHHLLKQRNSYLKYCHEKRDYNTDLLDTYDPKLLKLAKEIHLKRQSFLDSFIKPFHTEYEFLSTSKERCTIEYSSEVGREDYNELFLNSRSRDFDNQRTNNGVHKDRWVFSIDDNPLKYYGSQGQKKTFLLALKLTQFDYVLETTSKLPILLLDDIFDKLDDQRIEMLMQTVVNKYGAQTLITDARPERTENILSKLNFDAHIISVDLDYEEEN